MAESCFWRLPWFLGFCIAFCHSKLVYWAYPVQKENLYKTIVTTDCLFEDSQYSFKDSVEIYTYRIIILLTTNQLLNHTPFTL